MAYLFAAYAAVLALLFAYLAYLDGRLRSLERRLGAGRDGGERRGRSL